MEKIPSSGAASNAAHSEESDKAASPGKERLHVVSKEGQGRKLFRIIVRGIQQTDDAGQVIEDVSPINHLTKDDPPVLLIYSRPLDAEITTQGIGIHHALFGKALKEKMDYLKIPCEVVAGGKRLGGGTPTKTIDFLKDHFGMKK